MGIENFNHTIDIWIKALEGYTYHQLITRPTPTRWSIGQVYMHLLEDTTYYIEQIQACVTSNENATLDATPAGKTMLSNNAFPDELLEGAPSNAFMPQPESKEQLMKDFLNLKAEMNQVARLVLKSRFHGKTKHPGLDYFNANEWIQFADMHLRHHLRQKKRIDAFLEGSSQVS